MLQLIAVRSSRMSRSICFTRDLKVGRRVWGCFSRTIPGYDTVRTTEGLQLGAYIGACVLREIPYWRILYICNTPRTASYFSREIVGRRPGSRAFAGVVASRKSRGTTSNQNWIV